MRAAQSVFNSPRQFLLVDDLYVQKARANKVPTRNDNAQRGIEFDRGLEIESPLDVELELCLDPNPLWAFLPLFLLPFLPPFLLPFDLKPNLAAKDIAGVPVSTEGETSPAVEAGITTAKTSSRCIGFLPSKVDSDDAEVHVLEGEWATLGVRVCSITMETSSK